MNIKFNHRTHIRWLGTVVAMVIATSVVRAETVTYYVPDHLGSPIAAMDQSGALLWRESYTPYGEKRLNPSQADDDTGYTGHQFDADTDLVYMQARYYDPVIGRFMAVDPVGFSDAMPWTFNRYAYVSNNPFKYTDPTGMQADESVCEEMGDYCRQRQEYAEEVKDTGEEIYEAAKDTAMAIVPVPVPAKLNWIQRLLKKLRASRYSDEIIEAAVRLGVDPSNVEIVNGIARLKIDISWSLDPTDIQKVREALASRGAKTIEVESGYVVNPKLKQFLRRRVEDGQTFHGGVVQRSKATDSDFVIIFE